MNLVHYDVEMIIIIIGGSVCSALLVARLVLLAFGDLRQTWHGLRKAAEPGDKSQGPGSKAASQEMEREVSHSLTDKC
jgi:hypothetical protein